MVIIYSSSIVHDENRSLDFNFQWRLFFTSTTKKWRFLTRQKWGKIFLGNCYNWSLFTVTCTKMVSLFHVWLKTMQNNNLILWLQTALQTLEKRFLEHILIHLKRKFISASLIICTIYYILFTFQPEMKTVQHFIRKIFVTH